MLTQEEKELKVLQNVPFNPTSQMKIAACLKGEVDDQELYLLLSNLVAAKKIKMSMGPKGPEFAREWNGKVDEERKELNKELVKRFTETTIFFPRYDSYVANIEDNFIGDDYINAIAEYTAFDAEYGKWHRNEKTNVVYPPKLHAVNSASVLSTNFIAGLGVDPEQVEYAVEYEVISAEAMADNPDKMSAPKAFFDAIINYDDSVDFVQADLLEHYRQIFRQSLWAYQFGDRYLFDDEDAKEAWRRYAKTLNPIYFDSVALMKTMIAVYSDILANPDDYKGKKVNVLNIAFGVSENSNFAALADFQKEYDAEAKREEEKINEVLAALPLPEGTTLTFQYLKVDEVAESLNDDVKEYIKNRYLDF